MIKRNNPDEVVKIELPMPNFAMMNPNPIQNVAASEGCNTRFVIQTAKLGDNGDNFLTS
ncbi:hypothetical protein H0G86_000451 [Trichoderma simmonsii]|uniref:Uncharacterized protein n=1 Tax=Trichoderma simmonsii TaxID=1491479 RepID=A0A8G0P9H4_9HYPO|nr:hypothetical protein H0G86_000451 [Trichoderma simmonsii]